MNELTFQQYVDNNFGHIEFSDKFKEIVKQLSEKGISEAKTFSEMDEHEISFLNEILLQYKLFTF